MTPPSGFFRPLPRLDRYYALVYLKIAALVAAGCVALVVVADLFQKAEKFMARAETGAWHFIGTIAWYYLNFAPLLLFHSLLPVVLLLPAVIALTGAAQHNEYVVLRASGVSIRRALAPLCVSALALSLLYAATRDAYVPGMAIASKRMSGELNNSIDIEPIQVALADGGHQHSVAVGRLDLEGNATNFLLEIRDRALFRQYAGAAISAERNPNDVFQYIARKARLRPRTDPPAPDDDRLYEWAPVEGGRRIEFTYYARREESWTRPVPTRMTPAMFERHTLGDMVLRRDDLARLEPGDAGIAQERHRRNAEPWRVFLVVLLGSAAAMRLALGSRHTSYVQNVLAAMLVAGAVYFVAALCDAIGGAADREGSGTVWAVWLPLILGYPLAAWLWWRLDA